MADQNALSKDSSASPSREQGRKTEMGQSDQGGGDGAEQAMQQERQAVAQMGDNARLRINEAGRTNDSHAPDNPEGAVHGLPKPALKGTWR